MRPAPLAVSSTIVLVTTFAFLAGCGMNGGSTRDLPLEARIEMEEAIKIAFGDVQAPKGTAEDRRTEHFVAVDGTAAGDGSKEQPWPLAHALSGSGPVQAGDTIWLRGGEYRGAFVSELIGAAAAPIIVRPYPPERAVIAGCENKAALTVNGQYTWMWGFEVTGCGGPRTAFEPGSHPEEVVSAAAVDVFGTDIKIIGLIVHDAPMGIGCWAGAKRASLVGNIIYNNGWDGPDRGHGHGIYVQNDAGTKFIHDNIVFNQFGNGIHAYAEKAPLNNMHFTGNIAFMNGSLSKTTGLRYNLLVGGETPLRGVYLERNFTYFPGRGEGGANNIGYSAGCEEGSSAQANYFIGGVALRTVNCQSLEMKNNVFYGPVEGFSDDSHPGNNFFDTTPTVRNLVVRTLPMMGVRAHVLVYNWSEAEYVEVDLTDTEFSPGDMVAIRSVEDLFGEPVVEQYEEGRPLLIPTTGWGIASPQGLEAPASTLPEFGVFVLDRATAEANPT